MFVLQAVVAAVAGAIAVAIAIAAVVALVNCSSRVVAVVDGGGSGKKTQSSESEMSYAHILLDTLHLERSN